MADIRTIQPGIYNLNLAKAIKDSGDFEKPEWINFVKSGASRVRPIEDPDFWYKRAAGVLRQMYIRGIVGVGRLRSRYGGRKNRGMKPAHFMPASGKIIRKILQQAESAGLIEKVVGKHAGRQLTKQGREFLESATK